MSCSTSAVPPGLRSPSTHGSSRRQSCSITPLTRSCWQIMLPSVTSASCLGAEGFLFSLTTSLSATHWTDCRLLGLRASRCTWLISQSLLGIYSISLARTTWLLMVSRARQSSGLGTSGSPAVPQHRCALCPSSCLSHHDSFVEGSQVPRCETPAQGRAPLLHLDWHGPPTPSTKFPSADVGRFHIHLHHCGPFYSLGCCLYGSRHLCQHLHRCPH